MAVFKCKMCGGQLEVQENQTVIECDYCGTKQTLPTLDNEKKLNLFNRANRLRMSNEFDKAAGVFESIVAEFPEESEAYWGLCLCKYGIEYVDDPKTGKKVPTCHRTRYESIFDDNNFDMALEYADSVAVSVYRNEAKEIDRLQKAILEIASKEEPFDVFICYKETAEDGQRTKDSVMAQDIYDRLTDKGYKVFFARITLEDKLGQEYEPFIFSALNSAKVMLAIGTKYEYYNAVWVKNEWSRYLELMKKDKEKLLIPCYADIDAYDMPNEFRNLQGQDMNKIGFIQDLIRGISKVIPLKKEEPVVAQVFQPNSTQNTIAPLLKRAKMFLDDRDWKMANEYFDKVLDLNPECGEAYAGKFLAEKHCLLKELIGTKVAQIKNAQYNHLSIPDNTSHIESIISKFEIPEYLSKEEISQKYYFDLHYKSKLNDLQKIKNEIKKYFELNKNFEKILKYVDGDLSNDLIASKNQIDEFLKNEEDKAKIEEKENYKNLIDSYSSFITETDKKINVLYNEALEKKAEDERIAWDEELKRQRKSYEEACLLMTRTNLEDLINAKKLLLTVNDLEIDDLANLIADCDEKISNIKLVEEKKKKKKFIIKSIILAACTILLGIALTIHSSERQKQIEKETTEFIENFVGKKFVGTYAYEGNDSTYHWSQHFVIKIIDETNCEITHRFVLRSYTKNEDSTYTCEVPYKLTRLGNLFYFNWEETEEAPYTNNDFKVTVIDDKIVMENPEYRSGGPLKLMEE